MAMRYFSKLLVVQSTLTFEPFIPLDIDELVGLATTGMKHFKWRKR